MQNLFAKALHNLSAPTTPTKQQQEQQQQQQELQITTPTKHQQALTTTTTTNPGFSVLHAHYYYEWQSLIGESTKQSRSAMWAHLITTNIDEIKERTLMNEYLLCPLRSLRWKLMLGCLNGKPSEWQSHQRELRNKYHDFVSQFVVDPHYSSQKTKKSPTHSRNCSDEDCIKAVDNLGPLSQSQTSLWQRFFRDSTLRNEINEDVVRTNADNPFFSSESTIEMMNRLLFVYASFNTSVKYVQGMNEILGTLLWSVYADRCPCPDEEDSSLAFLTSEQYLEADAFWLFERVLRTSGKWFLSPKLRSKHSNYPLFSEETNLFQSMDYNVPENPAPVSIKCEEIHQILKLKDPQVAARLTWLGIEPELFLLRWVRILLAQVYGLDECMILWDAIFACDITQFLFLDHLCVSLLVLIRDRVLNAKNDSSSILQILFHYPKYCAPPTLVVSLALASYNNGLRGSRLYNISAPVFPEAKRARFPFSNTSNSVNTQLAQQGSDITQRLEQEVWTLLTKIGSMKHQAQHTAQRLERVLYLLHSLENSSPQNAQIVTMIVSEISLVRENLIDKDHH